MTPKNDPQPQDYRPYRIRYEVNAFGDQRWTVSGPHPKHNEYRYRRVYSQKKAEAIARRWLKQWQAVNTWREVIPEERNT